ncbi:hypothetical protein IMZ48_49180 [Candidatus Bathyarchaeota archaeon]|nr:hypothetical protein [Candidatus Bathyarchaeota archaeon]
MFVLDEDGFGPEILPGGGSLPWEANLAHGKGRRLPKLRVKGIIPGNVWHEDPSFNVKGGFILPQAIQEATILHDI